MNPNLGREFFFIIDELFQLSSMKTLTITINDVSIQICIYIKTFQRKAKGAYSLYMDVQRALSYNLG